MMFTMPQAMTKEREIEEKQQPHATSSSTTASSTPAQTGVIISTSLPGSLVDAWLDHCADCFKDKEPYPTPRSYFETHLKKDTMLDVNGIAIVLVPEIPKEKVKEDGTKSAATATTTTAASSDAKVIASTARVFVRQQYINGAHITFGGIGEVCTDADYRKHGYADLAIRRCLAYTRKLKMQLASLHASAELAPYYQSKGFQSVERWFGLKSDVEAETDVNIVGEGLKHGAFSLRLMPFNHFFNSQMLPQFQSMYETYSQQFNGPLVRTPEYWESWVQADLETSIGQRHRFPIEIYSAFEEWDGSDPAPVPASPVRFLSYMFLQRVWCAADNGGENRDRLYVVREYAATKEWSSKRADGGRQMFLSLVQYAVRQIRHKFAESDPQAAARAKITVKFPLPITAAFKVPLKVDEEVCDPGFMYQPVPISFSSSSATSPMSSPTSTFSTHRGVSLEETPIHSPFAATPFVLHHSTEPMTETSAEELLQQLKQDAKKKVVFWQTDGF